MTNEERALRVIPAIREYRDLRDAGEDDATAALDMIVDMLHAVAGWGYNPHDVVEHALTHYYAEVSEEG